MSSFRAAGGYASLTLLLVLVLSSCTHAQSGQTLRIAAAADLQPILPTLAAAYEKATGTKIVTTFGSSATLTQQIQSGLPADLFLSADFIHPEQLIAANLATGLANTRSPTEYARGVLVLWARKDSPAQPLSLDSLSSDKVRHIAVANDLHAPYGLAATEAFRRLRLTTQVAPKLVVAENVMQTAQFAETGNAQAAAISLTIASSPHFRELGTFVRFPAVYPEIHQTAVILKTAKDHAAAEAFLRWLTSPALQSHLKDFGLDPAR